MRRRSFQARLLSLMVWALVLFEAATLTAIHVAGRRSLRQTLADELRVGARVLNRILRARERQLADAARVSAADFAFREAIASADRSTITSALANLGARVDGHAVFLISLDGSVEADTLGGQFVGRPFSVPSLVTGSQAEIDKVVKDWGAVAEKVPQDDGGYLMNHTASVFLVNSKGQFQGTIAYGEDTATALEKIKRLVANS